MHPQAPTTHPFSFLSIAAANMATAVPHCPPKQDLPPPGGYKKIPFARVPPKSYFTGDNTFPYRHIDLLLITHCPAPFHAHRLHNDWHLHCLHCCRTGRLLPDGQEGKARRDRDALCTECDLPSADRRTWSRIPSPAASQSRRGGWAHEERARLGGKAHPTSHKGKPPILRLSLCACFQVGTYYGEPVYKTLPEDTLVTPIFKEFYAHTDWKAYAKRANLKLWS